MAIANKLSIRSLVITWPCCCEVCVVYGKENALGKAKERFLVFNERIVIINRRLAIGCNIINGRIDKTIFDLASTIKLFYLDLMNLQE